MKTAEFIEKRKDSWIDLDKTLKNIGKITRFKAQSQELSHLMHNYRRTIADLSLARSLFPGDPIIKSLNALVVKAMIAISTREESDLSRISNFFSTRIPQLIRKLTPLFLVSLLIFCIATLAGYGLTSLNPYAGNAIVGDQYIYMTLHNIAQGKPFAVYQSGLQHWMSSYIMANNIKVAFMAFALGAFYGVGTFMVLFSNGLMLGSIAAVFAQKGLLYEFSTTVLIHGTLELFAIMVAGAAGLRFGQALFRPGDRRRIDALYEFGIEAFQICAAMVPIFIIAATIEGYITRLALPISIRWAIIIISLLFLFSYLGIPTLMYYHRKPKIYHKPAISLKT